MSAPPKIDLPPEKGLESPENASSKADSPSEAEAEVEVGESVNEKSLLRKLDAKLLPAVGILYLLSFLDRSNGKLIGIVPRNRNADELTVGNARIEGLTDDLHMSVFGFPSFAGTMINDNQVEMNTSPVSPSTSSVTSSLK